MNIEAFSTQQIVDAIKSAKQRDPSRGKGTNIESKCSKIGKNQSQQSTTKCERCSGPPHQRQAYLARNSNCGKIGHWTRACKSTKLQEI